MNRKKRAIIMTVFALAALGIAGEAYAQAKEYTPLVTLPGVLTKDVPTDPVSVIKGIYGLAIGIGSIIAVAMVIYAGFEYMYQESISGKSGAKDRITNAFIGLLVILSSYIILRTINADLVNFNLNLPAGEGRLRGLIAVDKDLQDLRSKLYKASSDAALRNKDIKELEAALASDAAALAELQTKIADLKKKPQTEENLAVIKAAEDEMAALKSRTASIQTTINDKTLENLSATTKEVLSTSRQVFFVTEVSNLGELVKKDELEKASLESRTSLQKLSANTAMQLSSLSTRIETANKLPVSGGDEVAKRDGFVLNAQQEAAYLAASKNMIDDSIASIDTVGLSGVKNTSAKFDSIAATYLEQAKSFEEMGRADLAANLKNDLGRVTEIMKIRQIRNCEQYEGEARQAITLCKE